jgi:hypothetical protein
MEDFYYIPTRHNAGTVKPLGVAPPEAAVYLTEIITQSATDQSKKQLSAVASLKKCGITLNII